MCIINKFLRKDLYRMSTYFLAGIILLIAVFTVQPPNNGENVCLTPSFLGFHF